MTKTFLSTHLLVVLFHFAYVGILARNLNQLTARF